MSFVRLLSKPNLWTKWQRNPEFGSKFKYLKNLESQRNVTTFNTSESFIETKKLLKYEFTQEEVEIINGFMTTKIFTQKEVEIIDDFITTKVLTQKEVESSDGFITTKYEIEDIFLNIKVPEEDVEEYNIKDVFRDIKVPEENVKKTQVPEEVVKTPKVAEENLKEPKVTKKKVKKSKAQDEKTISGGKPDTLT